MKITKRAANYRKSKGSHTCHNCKNMNNDGTCKRVQGQVEPDYVCDLWQSRSR